MFTSNPVQLLKLRASGDLLIFPLQAECSRQVMVGVGITFLFFPTLQFSAACPTLLAGSQQKWQDLKWRGRTRLTSNTAVSLYSGCKMKPTVSKGHFWEFSKSFSYQAFPIIPVNKTEIAGPGSFFNCLDVHWDCHSFRTFSWKHLVQSWTRADHIWSGRNITM